MMMERAGVLIVEKESRHRFYRTDGQKVLREFENIAAHFKTCINQYCPETG